MKQFHFALFRSVVCLFLSVILLSGCGRIKERQEAERKRAEEKAKAEAAKKVVHEKSTEIWKQSMEKQRPTRRTGTSNGSIRLGDKTLSFSKASVVLGALKSAQDGSQELSLLHCSGTNNISLTVPSIRLDRTATGPLLLAGQSFEITGTNNAGAEITSDDGSKWHIQSALINFIRADRDAVVISIEGNALDASGNVPDKVKINGEIRALVTVGTSKPTTP